MHAELELLVCSGGLRGKQHTYALVDERVAPTPPLRGDDALAELTRRFFSSHGPATVRDFTWWASLTAGDARRGIELAGSELRGVEVDGRTYWSGAATRRGRTGRPVAHLLPCYDELVVGYSESRDVLDVRGLGRDRSGVRTRLEHLVLLDGQLAGYWRRTPAVETRLLRRLDPAERDAVDEAIARYERFAGLPARAS
jgi:Winged helix DNA-binding domain